MPQFKRLLLKREFDFNSVLPHIALTEAIAEFRGLDPTVDEIEMSEHVDIEHTEGIILSAMKNDCYVMINFEVNGYKMTIDTHGVVKISSNKSTDEKYPISEDISITPTPPR